MLQTFPYILLSILLLATPTTSGAQPSHNSKSDYIITLNEGVDLDHFLAEHELTCKVEFEHVFNGFVACLTPEQVQSLSTAAGVLSIEEDIIAGTTSTPQIPSGLKRMGVAQFPPAMINGLDERIDVDVAVLETGGVQLDHPDLNVVHHKNTGGSYVPRNHATACAGIIGALDNEFGTVGIAPGARIWAINMSGTGTFRMSQMYAGFDYVAKHADEIEVVNCSFGTFYGNSKNRARVEQAVRACVDRGVVVVCGAGNDSSDIAGPNGILDDGRYSDNTLPAALPESMAVSAIHPVTDVFAYYSNYSKSNHQNRYVVSPGAGIDVAAPTYVATTVLDSGYTLDFNGTSAAAPHVTGLVALYIAQHGRARDAEGVYRIRQAIVDASLPQSQWRSELSRDPDENPEGLATASLAWMRNWAGFSVKSPGQEELEMSFDTHPGYTYRFEASSPGIGSWTTSETVDGDGVTKAITRQRYEQRMLYRIRAEANPWPVPKLLVAKNLGSAGEAGNGKYVLATPTPEEALFANSANKSLLLEPSQLNGHVQLPSMPDLEVATQFSAEIWINPALVDTSSNPYSRYSPQFFSHTGTQEGGYAGWLLGQYSGTNSLNNSALCFLLITGEAMPPDVPPYLVVDADIGLEQDKWYHVVGVFDGTDAQLYVDGQLEASLPLPSGQSFILPNSAGPTIGSNTRGSRGFLGNLDEAAIYNYALSAEQVRAHFEAGMSDAGSYAAVIKKDRPVGYWRMND